MSFANPTASEVRDIVRNASKRTKIPEVKDWLFKDEKGVWEKEARRLLTDEETQGRFVAAGIATDEEFRDEVTSHLTYLALTATIRNVERK